MGCPQINAVGAGEAGPTGEWLASNPRRDLYSDDSLGI